MRDSALGREQNDTVQTPTDDASWHIEPGLEPSSVPEGVQAALGSTEKVATRAHHIVGSDGAHLDPTRLHLLIDRATIACGSCGQLFRLPHLDLTLHGSSDAKSSAFLECPHCRATIRLTAIDDPSAPQAAAHWITTAQLSDPAGTGGPGWAELRSADLDLIEEGPPPSIPPPARTIAPAAPRRPRRLLTLVSLGALLVAGLVLALVAAQQERTLILVVSAVVLSVAVIGTALTSFSWIHNRLYAALATAAVVLVAAGSVFVANNATARCSSYSPGANLSSCDLTGANLSGRDLTGANFARADLSGANLSQTDLTNAKLTLVRLAKADLTGADLSSAHLGGAVLTGATLTGANATRADLKNAALSGAQASRADFTGADLGAADLSSATLTDAVLSGANLSGTKLGQANLERAVLTGANADSMTADHAQLTNADLSRATLSGASLQSAGAEGARFTDADLRDAVLTGLAARGADFSGANLSNADLTSATLTSVDLSNADLTSTSLRNADVAGADLTRATLQSTGLLGTTGLTNGMLASALGVPSSQLVAAVSRHDLRFEGPAAIARAVSPAVHGNGVGAAAGYQPSGAFHPVVAASTAYALASWLQQLNGTWTSPGIRFTELVATAHTGERVIETCQYNVHPITRYQSTLSISVYAARTGRLVAERAFSGSPPRACQYIESTSTWELHGSSVSYNAAFTWLKQLVHPLPGNTF